ncbi:MAG: hypothetical protein WC612_05115 [Bdellovibrionales bacterium]|jgi:hypothetical protein
MISGTDKNGVQATVNQKPIVIRRHMADQTEQKIFDFFEAAAFLALSQKPVKLNTLSEKGEPLLTCEAHIWPEPHQFFANLSNYRVVVKRDLDNEPSLLTLKVLAREGLSLLKGNGASAFKTVFRATMVKDVRTGGEHDKIALFPVVGQPSDPFQTKWGVDLDKMAEQAHDSQRFHQILVQNQLMAG